MRNYTTKIGIYDASTRILIDTYTLTSVARCQQINDRRAMLYAKDIYRDARIADLANQYGEAIEAAAKRVQRVYRAVAVVDYLDMLIKAAKSRAKGVKPRCIDSNAVYSDCKMNSEADGITAAEIDEAKERRTYSDTAANVWRRDRNGFYI